MGFGYRNITIIVIVGVFGFLLGSFGIISSNNDNSLQTESVLALGHLQLVQKDLDGNIKQYIQTDNLIVDQGLNTMADLVFPDINLNGNVTDSKFSVLGIGLSPSSVGPSNVGLVLSNPLCANATASISGFSASSPSGADVSFFVIFNGTDGCTGTFQEAVIQNDLTDGEILARQTFPGITMAADDELDVFWDIEFGAAP